MKNVKIFWVVASVIGAVLLCFVLGGGMSSCGKKADDPVKPKEELGLYAGTWEADSVSYELAIHGAPPMKNVHAFTNPVMVKACLPHKLEIINNKSKFIGSEANDKKECVEKLMKGNVEAKQIVFEEDKDNPRIVLSSTKDYLVLKYMISMMGMPAIECEVSYKKIK